MQIISKITEYFRYASNRRYGQASNGGSANFSGQITDTPPQFKKWVSDHREDIAKSIYRDKVPYFIRDNAGKYIDLSAHKLSATQMRVVDNRAKYLAYDTSVWKRELFDKSTGGYVMTDLRRVEHSRLSKNEQAKFAKELSMAGVFAKNGYRVELLNEVPGVPSPDAIINGAKADFKRLSSYNNIVKEALSATKKQGASVVGFQFDTMNEKIIGEIERLRGRGIKGYYFVTGKEDEIIKF